MATSCILSDQPSMGDIDRNKPTVTTAPEYWNQELSESSFQTGAVSSPNLHNSVSEPTPPPTLPPKPPHGPPQYREPPRPPMSLPPSSIPPPSAFGSQQPDVCSSSPPKHQMDCGSRSSIASLTQKFERCEGASGYSKQLITGTQAWVQEQKSSGKMVGERLSSLQRKLRSLLTQSQPNVHKEPSGKSIPKLPSQSADQVEASQSDGIVNDHEAYQQKRNSVPLVSTSSSAAHNLSCILPMSLGNRSMTMESAAESSSYGHSSFMPERHPFESTSTFPETEDSTNLRDTCSKLFPREQKSAWSNYLSPRNFYSNNMKSPYDYDKVVTKEIIGKPSQDKKLQEPSSITYFNEASASSFPNLVVSPSIHHEPSPTSTADASNGSLQSDSRHQYSTTKDMCYIQDSTKQSSGNSLKKSQGNYRKKSSAHHHGSNHGGANDCGDASDQYKSSSESGRGTMLSSLRDSKSVVSVHSSGAASYLDTSLDSDHSATGGGLWDHHKHRDWNTSQNGQKRHPEDENNIQFSFGMLEEQGQGSKDIRDTEVKNGDGASYSESLSVTPPLPPLSPPPSSMVSANSSPHGSPKAKYKLSLSTTALNSCHSSKSHEQNLSECTKHKSASSPSATRGSSSKKSSVKRATSSTQNSCQHWNGKGKGYSSRTGGTNANHRDRYNHGNSSSNRKSYGSPSTKHTSRSTLVLPSYHELMDADMTSTTTGMDGESVIDDPDDCSSDMSMTASTMDPLEMSMIRNQLEGLETMYSEILHLLGVKNGGGFKLPHASSSTVDLPRHSRCRTTGSLSSLTPHCSNSRTNSNYMDKRGFSEKRRSKEPRTAPGGKRLQLLESHVVTLARSVAHLSSELRTQHMLVQELEHMRRDITWVHERLRLMQLTQGCPGAPVPQHDSRGPHAMPVPKDWALFRKEVTELLNPSRAKKLTKFFGDEPPLIRQFLNRLGYEKYASNFESEKIGIMELPYLTEERLHKIGVPMGPRMRILQEARNYCQQNQYKVYIV